MNNSYNVKTTMSGKPQPDGYRIQRTEVARYFFWVHILLMVVVGIAFFGIGIIVAIIYAFTIGKQLPKKQATALQYWLDRSTLRVDQGVYILKRQAIPLDRITDAMLVQGPLLRHFGLWELRIQTTGTSGQTVPGATLIGLENPEQVRDELLMARDAALKNKASSISI